MRLALMVFCLGASLLLLAGYAFRLPLLRESCRLRLKLAGGQDRWDLARRFEDYSDPAREVVEDWYIAQLDEWRPSTRELAARDPAKAVVQHGEIVKDAHRHAQLVFFHHADEETMARAAERLGRLRSRRAIPALISVLEHSNPELPIVQGLSLDSRRPAPPSPMRALHATARGLYPLGAEAVPSLFGALKSEKAGVRLQAMMILDWLGPSEEPVALAVLRGVVDPNPFARQVASDYMSKFDPDGERVIPFLAEGLRSEDPAVAKNSANMLIVLLGRNPKAAQALNVALRDPACTGARYALSYLARHGEGTRFASDLEPVLMALLEEGDTDVRREVTYAIRRLGLASTALIDELARHVQQDPDAKVRHGAVVALRELAPASHRALPVIREALQDEDERVRRHAKLALDRLDAR